ncbi:MAG: AMP-binding protein, partial [Pseudomonadales bacterium]
RVKSVAYRIENGLDWVVCDLAIMKAGIHAVPVPTFFSGQQVKHVLKDASADLYLFEQEFSEQGFSEQGFSEQGFSEQGFAEQGFDIGVNNQSAVASPVAPGLAYVTLPQTTATPDNPMKITYTSGSTGHPRGVCLNHETLAGVASSIVEAMANLTVTRHLCCLPLATLLENVAGLYAPLIRGVEINTLPGVSLGIGTNTIDLAQFTAALKETGPDSIIIVPQLLTALVALVQFGLVDASQFTMIAVGGGRVSDHLLESAETLGLPVYQGYGLSECASVVSLNLPGANRRGSVGRALPHARLQISESGEILVKGPVMHGYLGDALTAEGWYPTGDLGHLDADGYLFIDGRRRNVFITAYGRNVNPEWVEAALAQQPGIAQALVYGEGEPTNLALIWPRSPQTREQLQELVAIANGELPDYAQVHDFIVVDDALLSEEVTANGRLKREVVVKRYWPLIAQHYQQRAGK